MRLSDPQPAAQPTAGLLDPFAERATRPNAAPASSDLIDPFRHPTRRRAPTDYGDSVLRDPFATPAKPRPNATFPGLIDPFAA